MRGLFREDAVVPALIPALLAVVAVVALRRYYARETAARERETRRWWWERRKKDRDGLPDTARCVVAQGGFRARAPNESPWSYAKAFDRWTSKRLRMSPTAQWSKPYEQTPDPLLLPCQCRPRMPRAPRTLRGAFSTNVTTWAQLYWWTTVHGELVHRVIVLRRDEGQTFVLRCDHDARVDPTLVDQHLDGEGPTLTCVRCFGMSRT